MADTLGNVTSALIAMGIDVGGLPNEVKNQLVAVTEAGLAKGIPATQIAQQLAGALGGGTAAGGTPDDVARYNALLEAGYPEAEARARAFPEGGSAAPTLGELIAAGLSPEEAKVAMRSAALSGAGVPASLRETFLGGASGGGGGVGFAPPSLQSGVNELTGEALTFNPRTGQTTGTGQQVAFPGIDPRDAMAEEARRAGNNDVLSLAGLGDSAAQWRATLGENATMSRASLAEQARQADQSAILDEFRTRANLIPAFGQIALGAAQEQRQILSEGHDYLARAFGQANQDSPLGLVTQANLTNNLLGQLSAVQGLMPGGRVTGNTRYQDPGAYEGAPAFNAPDLTAFTRPGAQQPEGGWGQRAVQESLASGGNGYTGGSGAPAAGGAATGGVDPETALLMWKQRFLGADQMSGGNDRAIGGLGTEASPYQWASPDEAMAAERGAAQDPYNRWGPAGMARPGFSAPGGQGLKQGYRGYEAGGVTTEPRFIINEKGPELVENIDGGRIRVVDAKTTKKLVKPAGKGQFVMPGYDEGTASWGGATSVDRARRAWQEGLGGDISQSPGLAAASLFGGPSGGGMARMEKGVEKISPDLVKKALAEMKSSDLMRRLAMDETGGGNPVGWLGKKMSAIETRQHGLRMGATNESIDQALAKFAPPSRTPMDPTERLNKMYQEMMDARDSGDTVLADIIAQGIASKIGAGRYKGLVDVAEGQGRTLPGYANGTDPFANWNQQNAAGAIMGFTGQTARSNAASMGFNAPTFGTYGQGTYGGSGYAQQEARDRAINDARGWNDPAAMWDRANPGNTQPNPYRPAGPKSYTQEELIDLARKNAPPRVMDVRNGKLPSPANVTGKLAGFKAPTLRMLGALSPQDFGALNTLLNTESSGLTDANEILYQGMGIANPYGRQTRGAQLGFAL